MKKKVALMLGVILCCTLLGACGSKTIDDFIPEGYTNAPNTIYSTSASENGLENTFMYVDGIIIEKNKMEPFPYCVLETSEGKIALMSTGETDALEEGKEFRAFFMYMGMSARIDMPSGYYIGVLDPENLPDEIPSIFSEKKSELEKGLDSKNQTPEPIEETTPDPTVTPTSEPEEVTDAKALYDDVFAPIVNHKKWGTSDMLEDTIDNSGYEYKKEKGEPNRYTIYSKSSKKTHVYVSYLERDTGVETPMTVTFVLDGDEIASMGNYSSDGAVGYDKLTVNDTEVESTALARAMIFRK